MIEVGTHPPIRKENAHGQVYRSRCPRVASSCTAAVVGGQKDRGPKSDKRDGFALAEGLRIGAIKTRVYKVSGS
ncbi:hypothetical protein ACFL6M_04310 [Candidatus Eisenbacteria bacterium]|uniref:Transposase IS111A/IS1328/IS1533 N-terminal domain-containing protein n=1 Tax=Eiseniibacteriota bacterium TaxID=2212470 RepID=A0ABV6YKG7_UNCEI